MDDEKRIKVASIAEVDDEGVERAVDVEVTLREVEAAMQGGTGTPLSSGLLELGFIGGNIAVFTAHPEKILKRELVDYVPTFSRLGKTGIAMRIKEGSTFFATVADSAHITNCDLLSCDPEAVVSVTKGKPIYRHSVELTLEKDGGEVEAITAEATINYIDEDGGEVSEPILKYGLDPENLYGFSTDDGNVTVYELIVGLQMFSVAAKLGLERIFELYQQEKPARRPYLTDKTVMVTTDQIAGALFDPGRGDYIEPGEWWDETPKEIRSSKHGHIGLQLKLPTGIEIDDDPATYKLTAKERFWHETAEKLAREGRTVIRGSDLLKKNGYTNPYRKEAGEVMKEAARVMCDLTGRRIAIDTTDQYKHSRDGMTLQKQVTLRPIIDGEYSFTSWDKDGDEVRDFEVELRGSDPVDAFPMLGYQLERKMFADIPGDDDCLDGMRLTLDHRVMWREIRRHMVTQGLGRKIRFDTLFKSLGMNGATRAAKAKQERMLSQLEKMLDRAVTDKHKGAKGKTVRHTKLFKSWRYLTNNGRRYGIEITPLEG